MIRQHCLSWFEIFVDTEDNKKVTFRDHDKIASKIANADRKRNLAKWIDAKIVIYDNIELFLWVMLKFVRQRDKLVGDKRDGNWSQQEHWRIAYRNKLWRLTNLSNLEEHPHSALIRNIRRSTVKASSFAEVRIVLTAFRSLGRAEMRCTVFISEFLAWVGEASCGGKVVPTGITRGRVELKPANISS